MLNCIDNNFTLKKILQFIRMIGSRVIILYILGFLVCNVIFDSNKVLRKSRYAVLNRLRPESFDYIVNTHGQHNNFNKKQLEAYRFYYEKVIDYVEVRSDAYGMLGFCEYYLGNHKNTISAYQKAIEINPQFFWFYYNLGIIYLKNGDYQNAINTFTTAMRTTPQDTLNFIRASTRIYMPIILLNTKNFNISVPVQLKTGYRDCQILLFLSQRFLSEHIETSTAKHILDSKGLDLQVY